MLKQLVNIGPFMIILIVSVCGALGKKNDTTPNSGASIMPYYSPGSGSPNLSGGNIQQMSKNSTFGNFTFPQNPKDIVSAINNWFGGNKTGRPIMNFDGNNNNLADQLNNFMKSMNNSNFQNQITNFENTIGKNINFGDQLKSFIKSVNNTSFQEKINSFQKSNGIKKISAINSTVS